MSTLTFSQAIDAALAQRMASDPRILLLGEDLPALHTELYVRFGPERVIATPISESAFLGAAVTASMAGLRPVVEIMLVDFLGVAMDALLNHAAKVRDFSGGKWGAPLVVRSACGGGYGDGGQHGQSLWGWLAHIPGLSVVVPSTPCDAGQLMLAAIDHEDPVVFLEHKLLSQEWLEYLGRGGRDGLSFEVPKAGAQGPVPEEWAPAPLGKAEVRRRGGDLTMVSLGVGVHRCLEAAETLAARGVMAEVIDLRSVSPLDVETLRRSVSQTGRLLVVDEDYLRFGLSGEIAAVLLEAGIACSFARVCTEGTIPYARHLEDQVLPNTARILEASTRLIET
jgi:pyruvate dehydrogenase E1 component beta subunit